MTEKNIFTTSSGLNETFITAYSTPADDFRTEITALLEHFLELCTGTRPVWVKLHLSDIANQFAIAKEVFSAVQAPLVCIGQPPANGSRAAVESWNLPETAAMTPGTVNLQNYKLNFFNVPSLDAADSFTQMQHEFVAVEKFLAANGLSMEKNLQRTWIYCRDVDNNYAGLVQARREYFMTSGLTAQTHYISSTGIEGLSGDHDRLVRMDSLIISGNVPEQVSYLQAPEFLSPTNIYGVTFERGTRMTYGDRSHYYLSGTASIDCKGEIVHPGNVVMQTERMLDNVEALFASGNAKLADLKQAVVYLRDAADYKNVRNVLEKRLSPETTLILVRGAVCRPGWLVELEGIGANTTGKKDFKDFI